MGIKNFFCKFLGPRIDDKFTRFLGETESAQNNPALDPGKVIRIRQGIPAWGGRVAVILGNHDKEGSPVAYDVAVQDPDNKRIFYRIARGMRDKDIERGVDPRILEKLRSFGEIEFLALNKPLVHEVELL